MESERNDLLDATISFLWIIIDRNPNKTVEEYKLMIQRNFFDSLKDLYTRISRGEKIKNWEKVTQDEGLFFLEKFEKVVKTFEANDLWNEVLIKLESFGIKIKDNKFKFGISPKIRFFLSTIPDSRIGDEEPPFEVGLDLKNSKQFLHGAFVALNLNNAKAIGLSVIGRQALTKIDNKLFRIIVKRQIDETDLDVYKNDFEKINNKPKNGDMLLSIEPFCPQKRVLLTVKNNFGLAKLVGYKSLYNEALGFLYYHEANIEKYVEILDKEGMKYNANLAVLAKNLRNVDSTIQNGFVSFMRRNLKFAKLFIGIHHNDKNQRCYSFYGINVNKEDHINETLEDQAISIIEKWENNQKNSAIFKRSTNGRLIIDKDKTEEMLRELHEVNLSVNNFNFESKGEALIQKVLKYNGITMPKAAINELINNTSEWTKGTSLCGGFRRLFAITSWGEKPMGIISAIILKLNGFRTERDSIFEAKYKESYAINNPLYTELNAIKILAKLTAYYSPVVDNEFCKEKSNELINSFFY
jgi:hypothetical protein